MDRRIYSSDIFGANDAVALPIATSLFTSQLRSKIITRQLSARNRDAFNAVSLNFQWALCDFLDIVQWHFTMTVCYR